MSNPSTGGVDPGTQPSGSATGTGEAHKSGAERSFDPPTTSEPGHVPAGQDGGGTMSGHGSEQGEGWREQAKDAHESAERNRPDGGVGGGGVAGAGTGGGGMGGDSQVQQSAGLGGDNGLGQGSSGGGAITGAMGAGDAAERSADVGGSAGAEVPDDLRRGPDGEPGSAETNGG